MKEKKMTAMELDALKEVANIGAGNAAIATSQLMNKKIDIDIPSISYTDISKVPALVGDSESVSIGIYFGVDGDLKGYALFLLKEKTSFNLIDALMGTTGTKTLDENGESALKEAGNIVIGSYLNSMADFLEFRVLPGVPYLSHDYVGSMLNQILDVQSQYGDNILVSLAKFKIEGKDFRCHLIMIFDPESMRKTVSVIDKKLGL